MKNLIDLNKDMGMPNVLCVDATAFAKYNVEAGANIPILEFPVTCPDVMFANVRGTARAFDLPKWGSYAAHEWYGGIRHEDPLKAKDYATLLMYQAQLMADLPIEDPVAYTDLVCRLMK